MSRHPRRVAAVLACAALVVLSVPALAADMRVKSPVLKAPPPVAVYGWSGVYVGANVGYSWGRASHDWNFAAPAVFGGALCASPAAIGGLCSAGSGSHKLNGAIGGLQAGVNWQAANWLVGLETDIQVSGQKGDGFFTSSFATAVAGLLGITTVSASAKLDWLGTLRARAGVTFDRWLVYGTGGLAYGRVKVDAASTATGAPLAILFPSTCVTSCPFLPFGAGGSSHTRLGWTLGAGIEGALAGNWTVKLEYLHVDLGSVDTTFATPTICAGNTGGLGGTCAEVVPSTARIRTRVTDEIVRVGLNYRFEPTPVVARF